MQRFISTHAAAPGLQLSRKYIYCIHIYFVFGNLRATTRVAQTKDLSDELAVT